MGTQETIRAVIVDDEPLAGRCGANSFPSIMSADCRRVQQRLRRGEDDHGVEAGYPLSDIQLPKLNGFEVLE